MTDTNVQSALFSPTVYANSRVYHGDALRVLASLPPETCQMAVTSPPYWGLRDCDCPGQLVNVSALGTAVWKQETPTTNELFYLEQIADPAGAEHKRFREYLVSELGI